MRHRLPLLTAAGTDRISRALLRRHGAGREVPHGGRLLGWWLAVGRLAPGACPPLALGGEGDTAAGWRGASCVPLCAPTQQQQRFRGGGGLASTKSHLLLAWHIGSHARPRPLPPAPPFPFQQHGCPPPGPPGPPTHTTGHGHAAGQRQLWRRLLWVMERGAGGSQGEWGHGRGRGAWHAQRSLSPPHTGQWGTHVHCSLART